MINRYIIVLANEYGFSKVNIGNIYEVDDSDDQGVWIQNYCYMWFREVRFLEPLEYMLFKTKERLQNG